MQNIHEFLLKADEKGKGLKALELAFEEAKSISNIINKRHKLKQIFDSYLKAGEEEKVQEVYRWL